MPIRSLIEKIRKPKLEQWIALVAVLAVLGLVWAIGFPMWETSQLDRHQISQSGYDARVKLYSRIAEGLGAILPGLGGLALSGTAFAAIRNLRVAEDTRRIAEEKQVTDLFVKAVEMLADKERLEVRIGGIYALERIAKNSDRDHWMVMEVLTSFLQRDSSGAAFLKMFGSRETGSNKNEANKLDFAQADIQAALTVIGRRDVNKDPSDGRRLSLIKANLSWVHVEYGSDFRYAIFTGANLIKTYSPKADFTEALLIRANLRGAFPTEADFTDANLQQADLRAATIEGAILTNADLEGADLRGVEGRKASQIVAAKNWWLAKYDDEFAQELTEFAKQQAEHDPKFAKQLRLFEQNRQAQSEEPENPPDTSG